MHFGCPLHFGLFCGKSGISNVRISSRKRSKPQTYRTIQWTRHAILSSGCHAGRHRLMLDDDFTFRCLNVLKRHIIKRFNSKLPMCQGASQQHNRARSWRSYEETIISRKHSFPVWHVYSDLPGKRWRTVNGITRPVIRTTVLKTLTRCLHPTAKPRSLLHHRSWISRMF